MTHLKIELIDPDHEDAISLREVHLRRHPLGTRVLVCHGIGYLESLIIRARQSARLRRQMYDLDGALKPRKSRYWNPGPQTAMAGEEVTVRRIYRDSWGTMLYSRPEPATVIGATTRHPGWRRVLYQDGTQDLVPETRWKDAPRGH